MMNAAQYDEKALLLKAADGDRKAFTELYAKWADSLYNYVFLFCKSKEDSEEILQEVFVKLWEGRERLTEINSFKNYLFKAAKNKVINQVNHLQVRHRVFAEIKRKKASEYESASDEADYKSYYQIVQKAIAKLPPKRKLIFRLNVENGLSHDEIASQLQVSKSFVKNQLYKAYEFVRQYLSRHGDFYFPVLIFLFALIR
jgi:RNA polymerase sigma-70 factor (ECF subfamily)